jgi:hypothetical protein
MRQAIRDLVADTWPTIGRQLDPFGMAVLLLVRGRK